MGDMVDHENILREAHSDLIDVASTLRRVTQSIDASTITNDEFRRAVYGDATRRFFVSSNSVDDRNADVPVDYLVWALGHLDWRLHCKCLRDISLRVEEMRKFSDDRTVNHAELRRIDAMLCSWLLMMLPSARDMLWSQTVIYGGYAITY